TDVSGNVGASAISSIVYDITPPALSLSLFIDAGIGYDLVTNSPWIDVATGEDEDATTIVIYDDGVAVAAGPFYSGGGFSAVEGTHSYVVEMYDRAGNMTRSAPLVVTLDSVLPTAELALANDGGADSDDRRTNDATLSGVTEAGAAVVLTIVNYGQFTTTADAQGLWSIAPDLPADADGALYGWVKITDLAGNEAFSDDLYRFELDRSIDAGQALGLAGDLLVNLAESEAYQFSLFGLEDDIASAVVRFQVSGDAEFVDISVDPATGLGSVSLADLGDGIVSWTITAVDLAGNAKTVGAAEIVLDRTADAGAAAAITPVGGNPGDLIDPTAWTFDVSGLDRK